MKTKALFIIMFFLATQGFTQEKAIIKPTGNWYFGLEAGLSHPEKSFSAGVLSEYYVFKNWSVFSKIKYYKVAVDFHKEGNHGTGWAIYIPTYYGTFKGDVLSAALGIKWEWRFNNKLRGHISMGATKNYETKTTYLNYSSNQNTHNYKTNYISGVLSYGISYFFNSKTAMYMSYEFYDGTSKGDSGTGDSHSKGLLTSIGLKKQF